MTVSDQNEEAHTSSRNPKTPTSAELLASYSDEKRKRKLDILIDAESRGSVLAMKLKQQFIDFDKSKAEANHERLVKALQDMLEEFNEIEKSLDEDDPDLDEFGLFVADWCELLFDGDVIQDSNVQEKTYALILEEYRKSKVDCGPFGNSFLLQAFTYTNSINYYGFLLSPFISEELLRQFFDLDLANDGDLSLNMTSIAVSPILSTETLHAIVDGQWVLSPRRDLLWINLAILINANSDIYVLDQLGSYDNARDLALCYCGLPSAGEAVWEYGVCGSLTYMQWFSPPEIFADAWTSEDLIGELDDEVEDAGKEVLSNLIGIARRYLQTPQGKKEDSREKLMESETFGRLLVAFRMIQEFRYGRAKVEDELITESALVRSVLYWKPDLDSAIRKDLREKGLCFPEEIGELLVNGWNQNLNLIF